MRVTTLVGCTLVALVLGACTTTTQSAVSAGSESSEYMGIYGYISQQEYRNNYYGFRLQIPTGYATNEKPQIVALQMETQLLFYEAKNQTDRKYMMDRTVVLLAASGHGSAESAPLNPTLYISDINVKALDDIASEADLREWFLQGLGNSGLDHTDVQASSSIPLQGEPYSTLTFRYRIESNWLYCRMYFKLIAGHALVYRLSYITAADSSELQKALDSIVYTPETQI